MSTRRHFFSRAPIAGPPLAAEPAPAIDPQVRADRSDSLAVTPLFLEVGGKAIAAKVEAVVRAGPHVIVAGWSVGAPEIMVSCGAAEVARVRRFPRTDVARHFDESLEHEHGWVCVIPDWPDVAITVRVRHAGKDLANESFPLTDARVLGDAQLSLLGPSSGLVAFAHEAFSPEWVDALRHVPAAMGVKRKTHGHLESAMMIQGTGISLLVGWALARPGAHIWIEDSVGRPYQLDHLPRIARDDVQAGYGAEFGSLALESGFIAILNGVEQGNTFRLKSLDAEGVHLLSEVGVSQVPASPVPVARWLSGIPYIQGSARVHYERVAGPLIEGLIAHDRATWPTLPVMEQALGPTPSAPEVSIIVPLYGRSDFVEDQMVEWARDPWVRAHAEILYVIDDAALVAQFRHQAEELYRLYRVPFRWLWGHVNRGFSGANNLGAQHARAPRLLFLNSDVFPQGPGWIEPLVAHLDTCADVGAVGARLVFAEGGIQHAGMQFRPLEAHGVWLNHHPLMGLDPALDPTVEPTVVPAITGACMLVRAVDFQQVGGWDTGYLIGDFEDSDLCLKLREHGLSSVYVPGVQLTHLERQSMNRLGNDAFRIWVTLWNATRHDARWGRRIAGMMEGTP